MDALITQTEDVAWGAAVIAGTRVPVDALFDYLERGKTLDAFLEVFLLSTGKRPSGSLGWPEIELRRWRRPGEGAAR